LCEGGDAFPGATATDDSGPTAEDAMERVSTTTRCLVCGRDWKTMRMMGKLKMGKMKMGKMTLEDEGMSQAPDPTTTNLEWEGLVDGADWF
jgi:hypothetical protein